MQKSYLRHLVVWLFIITSLSVGAVTLPVAAQDGDNLLLDGGFEGEYIGRGRGDLTIPADWNLWFTESPRTEEWMNLVPVAFPHIGPDPDPHSGARTLNLNRGFGTFTAAVYQQVNVEPGTNLEAKVWGWLKTCNIPEDRDKCESEDNFGAFIRIGIDPNGGTDPNDGDIIWSGQLKPHDRWDDIGVEATATGGTVTVFIYMTQGVAAELNKAYVDDAELKIGGGGTPGGGDEGGGSAAGGGGGGAPGTVDFVSPQGEREDGSVVHIVQPGDTINSIAVAYGTTRTRLLEINNIPDPRFIQVGQEILIREDGADSDDEVEADAEATPEADAEADTSDESDVSAEASEEASDEILDVTPLEELDEDLLIEGEADETDSDEPDSAEAAAEGDDSSDEASSDDDDDDGGDDDQSPEEIEVDGEGDPLFSAIENAAPAPVASVENGEVLPANDPVAVQDALVCVVLFNDLNQNRIQEAGEALLPGGNLILSDDETAQVYETDGASEPHCFTGLDAGEYIAAAGAPAGFGLTTPSQFRVSTYPGTQINIAFGAAEGVEVAMAPPPDLGVDAEGGVAAAADTGENPLMDNAGLIVFGMAGVVLAVGTGLTFLLR